MILKNRFCALAVCATLVLLQSCAKEELDLSKLNQLGEPINITATATLPQANNASKVSVNSSTGKVSWVAGDSIKVNGTILRNPEINTSDNSRATFSGTASAVINSSTYNYWGIYPTSIDNGSYNATTPSVSVILPSTQTYNSNEILNNANPMVAFATNSSTDQGVTLNFKNLCSVIKIPVKSSQSGTSAQLKRIDIISSQDIAGTATVSWNSGIPSVNFTSGCNVITLNCGNKQLNASTADTFYVILPAGTQNLTIRLYDAADKYMEGSINNAALTRSSIHRTGTIELNAKKSIGFSVSGTDTVLFSPGNLQYIGSAATPYWKFAAHQWEYLGNSNAYNYNYSNKDRDLFGWGCTGFYDTRSDAHTYQNRYYPYSTQNNQCNSSSPGSSRNPYGYGPDYVSPYYSLTVANKSDWGCLIIKNPNTGTADASGTWRTLASAEWAYLLNARGASTINSTSNARYALVKVNSIAGMMIFPDVFVWPSDAGTAPSTFNTYQSNWNSVNYTVAQFAILENAGVVFLPAGGYRSGTTVNNPGTHGSYWSTTYIDKEKAYNILFNSGAVQAANDSYRYIGKSVRLVKNVH